jgi:hypothetical protein
LRDALSRTTPHILKAASDFQSAAIRSRTYQLAPHDLSAIGADRTQLEGLYTNGMVRSRSSGRNIYDRLLAAPENGTCPLCAHRDVSTLDHYLPKSSFPLLAVVPDNLVPSCKDCNSAKGTLAPTCAEDQLFHPYFDNADDDIWLQGAVQHSRPAAVLYSVGRPSGWSQEKLRRVQNHFTVMKLARLYASQAASELVSRRHRLQVLHQVGGPVEVRAYLQEEAISAEAAARNSWRTAMYRTLARDDWFCEGGFR